MMALLILFYISLLAGVAIQAQDDSPDSIVTSQRTPEFQTENGDIYDCVDFYKQPAFDHPLAKDYIPHLKVQMENHPLFSEVESDLNTGKGCPLGMVPIKRLTKEDLIKEKELNLRSELSSRNNKRLRDSRRAYPGKDSSSGSIWSLFSRFLIGGVVIVASCIFLLRRKDRNRQPDECKTESS